MNTTAGIPVLTDEETLEDIQQLLRERASLDARILRRLAHFFTLREHTADGKYASDEIAAAVSWSTLTAANQVDTAVRLVRRLPGTVDALESGRLDLPKARAI